MAANPNPSRIPEPLWWFWQQLDVLGGNDDELGGIYANKKGYHNTRAANLAYWPGNYSVVLPLDKLGPSDKSAGVDWTFRSAQGGNYDRIRLYSSRLLVAAKARDPRLAGLREFYGQADADTAVEGWDLANHESASSDSSHLWHIHFSFWRAYVMVMAAVEGVLSVLKGETLADYLARGGQLISGTTAEEDTMFCKKGDRGEAVKRVQLGLLRLEPGCLGKTGADGIWGDTTSAAVKRLLGGDGTYFGAELDLRLVEKLAARVSAPGPAGPAGRDGAPGVPGPAGPEGPAGRDGVVPDGATFVMTSPPSAGG